MSFSIGDVFFWYKENKNWAFFFFPSKKYKKGIWRVILTVKPLLYFSVPLFLNWRVALYKPFTHPDVFRKKLIIVEKNYSVFITYMFSYSFRKMVHFLIPYKRFLKISQQRYLKKNEVVNFWRHAKLLFPPSYSLHLSSLDSSFV